MQDGGDVGRHVRHAKETLPAGDSLFFQSFNRNKRSIALNLKTEAGQAALRRLAATADAVFNNLRGDLPGKLGLTYDDLKAVNPRLVCVHLSAYGRTGERAAWPGYDYLMQAECGYLLPSPARKAGRRRAWGSPSSTFRPASRLRSPSCPASSARVRAASAATTTSASTTSP